jgi:hypothetical protein
MPDAPAPLSSTARFLLRAGLVAAWLFGVGGGVTSCERLLIYHGPFPAIPRSDAPARAVASAPPSASASASSTVAAVAPAVASAAPSVASVASVASSASSASSAASTAAPAIAPAPATTRPSLGDERRATALEALDRFRKTRLPLSVANLLLSSALVIAAARTLSRRPGARGWLIQFAIANGLFALIELAVSRDERAFLIDRAMQLPEVAADPHLPMARQMMPTIFVGLALIEAGLFMALAFTLSRASVARELAPRDDDRRTLPPSSADDEDA